MKLSLLILLGFLLVSCSCSSDAIMRVTHHMYFLSGQYRSTVDPEGKGVSLLNTYVGTSHYDRKQNIGIMLVEGPNYDLCSQEGVTAAKKEYLKHIFNLEMFLFIKISGLCPFGAQIQEAMLIGAKGVILYDPEGSVRDSPFPKINVDSVNIPVLIMDSAQQGELLFQQMKKDDYDGAYVMCRMSYSAQKKEQFPQIQYFYSSVDKQSLHFIQSLFSFIKQYDPAQQLAVKAIPILYNSTEITTLCKSLVCIETSQAQILAEDCYSNGKYCTLHRVNYFKAKDVMDHELFQYQLSQENPLEWAKYMKTFLTDCVQKAETNTGDPIDLTDCGETIMKSYDQSLLNAVLKDVEDSWVINSSTQVVNKQVDDNKSFNQARQLTQKYGVHEWPTLILNDQLIQDSNLLLKDHLAQTLCKSYLVPSEPCLNLLHYGSATKDDDYDYQEETDDQGDDFNPEKAGKVIKPKKKSGVSKGVAITFSLILGFLLGAIIFYFVRREHIREMNALLDKKVKQAVQKHNKFNVANAQFQELA